jgi:hypothetical protein
MNTLSFFLSQLKLQDFPLFYLFSFNCYHFYLRSKNHYCLNYNEIKDEITCGTNKFMLT